MKANKYIGIVFSLIAIITFNSCTKVEPGYVGVKVKSLGGSKGVDNKTFGPGIYPLGPGEQMFQYPTFQQNYIWTRDSNEESKIDESISFQDCDGLNINGDFGINFHIDEEKIPHVYQKYRSDISVITHKFLRGFVRDAITNLASKEKVDYIYGLGKQKLMQDAQAMVQEEVASDGIIVDKIYIINNLRLPDKVKAALDAKMAAIQEAEQSRNEVQREIAEADKLEATARGQKAKQELEASTLTEELLKKMWIEKWNGVLPTTIVTSDGKSPLMMLPVKGQ